MQFRKNISYIINFEERVSYVVFKLRAGGFLKSYLCSEKNPCNEVERARK